MRKIILLDGNGLIFRAYFATATRMSFSNNNTPTNAIYLFSNILMHLIEKKDFDGILVALDSPGKKFRHKEYNDYKANRKEVPPELKAQFGPIKEFLDICNIPTIEIEGYEADDVIGTLITHAKEYDVHFEVYTGDKDLLQLISDDSTINMMHKGLSEVEPYDKNHLKEVWGFDYPSQIIDLKSLMGDPSDNIPGVKGVGEKTATDLVIKYGNLNNIYEHIDEIKGKLQEKLIESKEMAYLSYELATIAKDAPVDASILKNNFEDYDHVKLNKFFKFYGIKSLLKYTTEETSEKFEVNYQIVDKVSADLLNSDSFIVVDNDNANYHYGNIKGIAISNKYKSEYIPTTYITFDFDLIDYLSSPSIAKNVFDSKQAYVSLRKLGIILQNVGVDLLLAFYLIDQDFKTTLDLFSKFNIEIEPISKKASLEESSLQACSIAKASSLLKEKVLSKIEEINNSKLLFEVEQPLALILAKMEIEGVLIDTNLLNKLDYEYSNLINDLEDRINKLVGHEININSPKQLAELLYDELNLPCNKKRSTGADDLNYIKDKHPVVPLILEYRKYAKLLNTYIDSFNTYKFADNKIHSMFNQASTMTGRLSSSAPNLQNLSVRDEEKSMIRKLVIAKKGYKILSLDYSQIELRILAILSNDNNLLDAFKNDYDIHSATASKIYNVPIDKVDSSLRRVAKAVNFGIVYGISAWGLMDQINSSFEDAKNVIDKFFETYPGIKAFLDKSIKDCETNGYVTTLLNRRRMVPEITSSNYNIREFGKRVAMNTPIQGSAADIIKIAMINVNKAIEKYGNKCNLICQIHDELIFEVSEDIVETVKDEVSNIMENVLDDSVIKLKVSYGIGNNWLEVK